MNDLQIEYFLAVAENMSFTKTAEKLYVTQSAISRQIAVMEEELGVTLFDRTKKRIRLTDAGELFFEFYKNHREQFAYTVRKAKELNQSKKGRVKIGYVEYWNLSDDLLQAIHAFTRDFPNVTLLMECMDVRDLMSALKKDELDIVLTISDVVQKTPDIKVESLINIPRIFVISKNHPLSRKSDLTIRDLRNETFYSFGGQGDRLKELIGELYGFVPDIQVVNNMESAIACARNGLGIAVVNAWTSVMKQDEFLHIPFPMEHEIVLAMKKDTGNRSAVILANELTSTIRRGTE